MLRRRGPGVVRLAAGTAVMAGTAGAIHHRQEQRWAKQEQDQYDQQVMEQQAAAYQAQQAQQYAPPAAAAPAEPDVTAQLQQLAQLKEQGILTEEELAAKKKQLLGI
jgi:hypothetical protein